MTNFYAFLTLSVGLFVVFVMCLIALARIGKFMKATQDLDWEAVAAITGDIGGVKKSLQRVNNRINGMESADPSTLLQQLAQQGLLQNINAEQIKGEIKGG